MLMTSPEDLVREYVGQGYTKAHAEFLAGLASAPTPTPTPTAPVAADPRPDLPGKPPGSVPAPRSTRRAANPAKTPPPAPATPAPRTAATRRASAEIRSWAKRKHIKLSERGRIPQAIVDRYEREVGHA